MKKIIYEFADGIKEIEVSDEFAKIYEEIIKQEKRIERKEARRHSSLEAIEETGYQFADEHSDVEETLEKEESEKIESEHDEDKEFRAFLRREKKELAKVLTPKQTEALFQYVYLFRNKVDIAKKMGITEGAVRKLIKKAETKMEESYEKENQKNFGIRHPKTN